jgi:hypothetical protein
MIESKESSTFLLNTPVLFLIFNRPYTTSVVFKKIREAKPSRLYIASDGPREDNQNDKIKIAETRKVIDEIDWPCEIKTLFRKKNLGCKKAVSSAIDWFFENEEQGIILEDDCVPNLDFFIFCETLLDRYANNKKISVISGNNFQNGKWRGSTSYYFSKYPHIWGWATWRRAWSEYQADIPFWPAWKNSKEWLKITHDKNERNYWNNIFKKVHSGKIDSWAYPWMASIWYKHGLTATPNVNLVSNIGFGEDSTHTKQKDSLESNIPTKPLGKITHPDIIEINVDADIYDFEWTFGGRNFRFPRNFLLLPIKIFNFILRKFYKFLK